MSAYEGAMSGGAIFLTHHANTYSTICINSEQKTRKSNKNARASKETLSKHNENKGTVEERQGGWSFVSHGTYAPTLLS